jgi:hypothetical protein
MILLLFQGMVTAAPETRHHSLATIAVSARLVDSAGVPYANDTLFIAIESGGYWALLSGVSNGTGHVVARGQIAAPDIDAQTPQQFALQQNFPNPFNPSTNVFFDTPVEGEVSIDVFDLIGRKCKSVFSGSVQPGRHVVRVDMGEFADGPYLIRATFPDGSVQARRSLLMRGTQHNTYGVGSGGELTKPSTVGKAVAPTAASPSVVPIRIMYTEVAGHDIERVRETSTLTFAGDSVEIGDVRVRSSREDFFPLQVGTQWVYDYRFTDAYAGFYDSTFIGTIAWKVVGATVTSGDTTFAIREIVQGIGQYTNYNIPASSRGPYVIGPDTSQFVIRQNPARSLTLGPTALGLQKSGLSRYYGKGIDSVSVRLVLMQYGGVFYDSGTLVLKKGVGLTYWYGGYIYNHRHYFLMTLRP